MLASRDCRALWAQGYGSASCPPEAGCYNSAVTLTASAAADWAFYHWWGDVYVDDDQPVVALDTGMDRVIEAEFVWRPGVGALDLVSDLAVFLSEGSIFATVETFDRNEIDYDANLDPVFVGNGILDAAELALVEAVLKNAATDFSARGGITGDGVWKAWQTNLAQAQVDMASRSASVQRVVAAYMTLGDYKTVESIKDLVLAKFSVTLDDTPYDRSRQRYFHWKRDPDADGLDMLDEWALAAPPGQAPTLGDLPTFLAQSLNGVANVQASAGGAPPDCSNLTCPAMALVNLIPPSGGTLTVSPLDLQPFGTEITVTATPDPSYYFLGYNTTPATLVSGSLEQSASFPLTGPYSITPPYLYPVIEVSGTFWRSYLEIPLNPTSYSISVEGDNLDEVVDGNVRKFYGPSYAKLKVTLSNKSDTQKVAGAEIDSCVGCAAPGYALQTSFPVELPAFGAISVEPWFGSTLPETVTFSLASNEGGVVVGAQGAGGGVEFTRRLTAAKDSPVLFGARPYPGYRFVAWSSFADSHTGGTVRAEFEEIPGYRLTVETAGPDAPCSGYVSVEGQSFLGLPDGENNAKGIYYYQNGLPDKVALRAHASPGYCFKEWTGQIPDGADPLLPWLPLTMDEDKSVSAVFEKLEVALESVTFGGAWYNEMFKADGAAYDASAHTLGNPYWFAIPARAYDLSPDNSSSAELHDPICYGLGATGSAMLVTIELNMSCASSQIMVEGRRGGSVVFKTNSPVSASPSQPLIGPMAFQGTLADTIGKETLTIDWYISICGTAFVSIGSSSNPLYRIYPPGPQNRNDENGVPTAKRVEWLVDTASGLKMREEVAAEIAQRISPAVHAQGHFGPPNTFLLWSILDIDNTTKLECFTARELAYEAMLMLGVYSYYLGKDAAYPSTDTSSNPNYNSDVTDQESWGGDNLMFDMNNTSCSDGTCSCSIVNLSPAENLLIVQGSGMAWYYMSIYPYTDTYVGTGSSDQEKDKSAKYKIIDGVRDLGPNYSQMYYDEYGAGLCNQADPLP